jgi:uncharacterized integral membrane protein
MSNHFYSSADIPVEFASLLLAFLNGSLQLAVLVTARIIAKRASNRKSKFRAAGDAALYSGRPER